MNIQSKSELDPTTLDTEHGRLDAEAIEDDAPHDGLLLAAGRVGPDPRRALRDLIEHLGCSFEECICLFSG